MVKKADTSKVSSDSTQLTLSETPTAKNNTTGVPSSEEVAAKAEKFNVGIKLYGQSQSIFSSSAKNSLVGEGSGIIMG